MTTTAQLQHLWAASHTLAVISPVVSAHLMTRLLDLSHEKRISLAEATSRQVCTSCGTVAIPGVNSHVYTRRNRGKKRKAPKRTEQEERPKDPPRGNKGITARPRKLRVVYECRVCGRSRSQHVPQRKSKSSSRRLATGTPQLPPSATQDNARRQPSSQNVSSRKRAKSRKGNTLSDILAAKRKQGSSSGARGNGVGGFGLDLMDLMKAGEE